MSNYTKATNFTLKDGLVTGDVNKIIKGSEIDAEYVAISAAVSSKADLNGPTFTGTPNAPTATAGTSSTQIASTAFVQAALIGAYPIGSIYMNAGVATNPATLLGFGTWAAFGAGRVIVGFNAGDTLFDTLEETGGSKDAIVGSHTHTAGTLATDSQGAHQHTTANGVGASTPGSTPALFAGLLGGFSGTANLTTNSAGAHTHTVSGSTATAGVSVTNANIQPYITVHMWKRTA
jgi:hypothetical protein